MLDALLLNLLKLLVPGAQGWMLSVISKLIPAVVEIFLEVSDAEDKTEAAILSTASLLDDALDDIPEWETLSEDDRDDIIAGVAKLALFITQVASRPGGKRQLRQAKRTVKLSAKRS